MSKIDKTKESIGYLKVVFSIFIAIDVSLVAWLFQHSAQLNNIKLILGTLTTVLITFAIIVLNKKILEKIDTLEDM